MHCNVVLDKLNKGVYHYIISKSYNILLPTVCLKKNLHKFAVYSDGLGRIISVIYIYIYIYTYR